MHKKNVFILENVKRNKNDIERLNFFKKGF